MTTATTTSAPKNARTRSKTIAAEHESVVAPALKVSILQENLKRALLLVLHAVAGKSTLPVLSNILLSTDGADRLKISATNLEIAIVVWVGAKVEHEGRVTLPARLLTDVVGGLPNERVTMEMDSHTQTVHLSCARFEANIKGIEADEFPIIPTLEGRTPTATFAPGALRAAIGQVAFAAATDDTRPILTGVRIALKDKVASFAAADTFRLTFRDIALDEPAVAQEAVIPARAMVTLGKVLADVEGDVELLISPDGNQVMFRAAGLELLSRIIDGKYPDIARYRAMDFATVLEIDTKELAKAVKLASYFAAASSNIIRLVLEPAAEGKGTLTLSANAAEVGENTSVHDAAICGTGGKVALNVTFLSDGINAISTSTIALHYNSAQQPVVLSGAGDDSYTYVAMPMTLK